MLQRSLINWSFITDDGHVFSIDGMVPSGTLWTGWLDTALNALYLNAALRYHGIGRNSVFPKCAGDDNLTLLSDDHDDAVLFNIRRLLNEWFHAGIEDEEFLIQNDLCVASCTKLLILQSNMIYLRP